MKKHVNQSNWSFLAPFNNSVALSRGTCYFSHHRHRLRHIQTILQIIWVDSVLCNEYTEHIINFSVQKHAEVKTRFNRTPPRPPFMLVSGKQVIPMKIFLHVYFIFFMIIVRQLSVKFRSRKTLTWLLHCLQKLCLQSSPYIKNITP